MNFPSEQLRWDICELFIKYTNSKDLEKIQLAKKLEIHESEVIKVLHQRIERFSTDKLLDLLSKIYPKHKILLKAA
ncbi:MAG: XRE family transcriptional regulator [Pseudobdellovibrionaceae bacterium]